MFVDFLFHLRAAGLKVTVTEWMALTCALVRGHARASLTSFYALARALLVKRETDYDLYDRAFATFFAGVEVQFDIDDELWRWLENPVLPRQLTDEERAKLQAFDLETLRKELEKRLAEQKGRHDGGGYWIGTGGTSPFGHGGQNPAGIRIGGNGGGRSAVAVAADRRFANLRGDLVLDTRDIGAALLRLRRLARERGPEELDLDLTIDKSARNAGEIDLVFAPPRKNKVKLLLLMDVGGSMDPHTALCERLFSAAHKATHFKAFRHYFFHNCVYDRLYTDMPLLKGPKTTEVLASLDETWSVVLVGDAWMSPYELVDPYNPDFYGRLHRDTGLTWLKRFREKCPHSVWLNPEPRHTWGAPTMRLIAGVFPMFALTLDGLTGAIDALRSGRAVVEQRPPELER